MKNLFDIKGKVIVVTGAGGVLAGVTARYLANCGAKIAYLDRDDTQEANIKAFSEENGYEHIFCKCNVLEKESLEAAKAKVLEKFGTYDILINGAGGNMAGATISPDKTFFDLDMSAWEKVLKLNLEGSILPILVFAKHFEETKKGIILNFSSMTAQQTVTRVFGYSNAKAGIDNMTKFLAVEFAKKIGDGVRVNAIAPGFFISEQNRALLTNPDGSYTERGDQVINKTPFGRFGVAEEVFGTIHYLCSDASAFVTGTVVPVDGGFSCFSGV